MLVKIVTNKGGHQDIQSMNEFLLIRLRLNKYIFVVESYCARSDVKLAYYNPVVSGVGNSNTVCCPVCNTGHELSVFNVFNKKTTIMDEEDVLQKKRPRFASNIGDRIIDKGGRYLLDHVFPLKQKYMNLIISLFENEDAFWMHYPALKRCLEQ